MAEFFGWMVDIFHTAERRTTPTSHDCYSIEGSIPSENRGCCKDIMCNCITCCYLVLFLLLFSIGTAITVFTFNERESYFISLGHMWVIGPIFMCSGVMIAIKTIIYVRRQSVLALLTRQRDFSCPPEDFPSPRDPANFMLPPSYDSIAGECSQRPSVHLTPDYASATGTPAPPHQDPPPCYEEALLGGAIVPHPLFKGTHSFVNGPPLPKQSHTNRSERSDPMQRGKGPQTL